jgi:3-phosphoglycerate kinase
MDNGYPRYELCIVYTNGTVGIFEYASYAAAAVAVAQFEADSKVHVISAYRLIDDVRKRRIEPPRG